VKESKKNPRIRKALILLILIRGYIRILRIPGLSKGFGIEDGAYYLGYYRSIKSLLRRKPPTVLLLF
jgi:hypothetical protein